MELTDDFVRRSPRVDRSMVNYGFVYYFGQRYYKFSTFHGDVWRRRF